MRLVPDHSPTYRMQVTSKHLESLPYLLDHLLDFLRPSSLAYWQRYCSQHLTHSHHHTNLPNLYTNFLKIVWIKSFLRWHATTLTLCCCWGVCTVWSAFCLRFSSQLQCKCSWRVWRIDFVTFSDSTSRLSRDFLINHPLKTFLTIDSPKSAPEKTLMSKIV